MKKIKRASVFLILVTLSANAACRYNSFEKPNANAAPANAAANAPSALETDLQTMRTANLKYIFVFRRTDGGAFDGEDKKYLRANLPTTNRVLLTDEGKAFVVGSNYKFPPENTQALEARFKIENFSAAE